MAPSGLEGPGEATLHNQCDGMLCTEVEVVRGARFLRELILGSASVLWFAETQGRKYVAVGSVAFVLMPIPFSRCMSLEHPRYHADRLSLVDTESPWQGKCLAENLGRIDLQFRRMNLAPLAYQAEIDTSCFSWQASSEQGGERTSPLSRTGLMGGWLKSLVLMA